MNTQDFRSLQEAYVNVYNTSEVLDERVLGQDPEMRKAGSEERTTGKTRRLPPSSGKGYADNQKKSISFMNKITKNNKIIPGMTHEEVDIFDAILEHLVAEGYADTNENAIAIMANMSEDWRDSISELYKGKHGQSEKEYQDSRSDAGKMVSGDSKGSGAAYSSRGVVNSGPNPAGGSQKPTGQGRMTSGQRTEMQFRKVALKAKKEN